MEYWMQDTDLIYLSFGIGNTMGMLSSIQLWLCDSLLVIGLLVFSRMQLGQLKVVHLSFLQKPCTYITLRQTVFRKFIVCDGAMLSNLILQDFSNE